MDFLVLGPVEAYRGGVRLDLGRRRVERCLLGLLLLDAGRVVPVDRLAGLLWDDDPPAHARRSLQVHVSRIRSLLDPERDGRFGVRLAAVGDGYVADVDADVVDAHRFRSLVERAGREPDPQVRAGVLREALALWRGPLLADVASDRLRDRIGVGLDELRLSAWETCLEADLACGRHHQAVPELTEMVGAHPLRERLVAGLMVALYRDGRQPDALEVFRQARVRLVEELGLEPGEALRRLHESILRADPVLDLPAAPGVAGPALAGGPAQLPADPRQFTGRAVQLQQLDELMAADGATQAVVISAIAGAAGVGKTALAVHWAHRVRDRFPDGQLHVNLRGYDPASPVRPVEALAGFLRALGVAPERVPDTEAEAAALYRSRLADQRVLIVLDNARDAEQVRPLLPGAPGCLVVVTSRDRLTGLVARDGALRISLDVLTAAEAHHLLVRALGADRVDVDNEPPATAELAQLCAYLPLALRIAAAKLLDDPAQSIAGFVARMRGGDRLAALAVDGDDQSAVRAAFDLSYAALPEDAQRMFRLLGLVPGPDVTADTAAALAGTTPDGAGRLLDRLVRAHLLDRHQPGRYTFHDLLRAYAIDLAHRHDSEPDRHAARTRLFDFYLHAVDTAARLLYPQKLRLPLPERDSGKVTVTFNDQTQAFSWLDTELPNLVAAVNHAAEHGPRPAAWLIADALRGYFISRMQSVEWATLAEAGLAAARADGNEQAEAAALFSLADRRWGHGRLELASEGYMAALVLSRRVGWLMGEMASLGNLGSVYLDQGRLRQAEEIHTEGLALHRRIGNVGGQAVSLINLGLANSRRGRLQAAAEHYEQAVAIFHEIGALDAEAGTLMYLGAVCRNLGRHDRALAHVGRALDLQRETRSASREGQSLVFLGAVYRDVGRHDEAGELARAAVTAARETGELAYEIEALNALTTFENTVGKHTQARLSGTAALTMARDTSDRHAEAEALIGLATSHRYLGDYEQALAHGRDALILARELEYRMLEGQVLTALAAIDLATGALDDAIRTAEEALAVHRETGHRPGEARTLVVLGHAMSRAGDEDAAATCWRQAREMFTEMGMPEGDEIPADDNASVGGRDDLSLIGSAEEPPA